MEERTSILILADSHEASYRAFSDDANFVKTRFPLQARISSQGRRISVGTVDRYYMHICTEDCSKLLGMRFQKVEYVDGCKFYPAVIMRVMSSIRQATTGT